MKVLFVCLGNICRSPTAEGVFRRYVEQAGLSDKISIFTEHLNTAQLQMDHQSIQISGEHQITTTAE